MSLDLIREYLSYDCETGIFTWLKKPRRGAHWIKVGDAAGSATKSGYQQIGFMGKVYYAHRLAWWWIYGEMPDNEIDHRNHNKGDNRIVNLRRASRVQNCGNSLKRKASGYRGVWSHRGQWAARIGVNYRTIYLGSFPTPEAAARAYDEAARQHYGEFASTNFP